MYWRALYVDSSSGSILPAAPLTDLDVVSGGVVFQDGQSTGAINITVRRDGVPELEEMYMIELMNVTGGVLGATVNRDSDTSTITIAENDSPYGLFGFAPAGTVWLAEDLPGNDTFNGTESFNVTRAGGTFGAIEVNLQ